MDAIVAAKKQTFFYKLFKLFYDIKEVRELAKQAKEFEKQRHEQADKDFSTLMSNIAYRDKYASLLDEFNKLVDVINKKGGKQFLDHGVLPQNLPDQFSQEEIRTLINLCHPDKHNGKESAVEITKKLLNLRK